MKLYYTPGTCSLAPHIVLRALEVDFELIKVDLRKKITEKGDDFREINPLGLVPTLEISGNGILTEGVAIIQYLCDQLPEKKLVPQNGTIERAHLYERLNYLSAELHKSFYEFFHPSDDAAKSRAITKVKMCLNFLNESLSERKHLLGDSFSIADIYLFVQCRWTKTIGIDLNQWENISSLCAQVKKKPFTQEAMMIEGIE